MEIRPIIVEIFQLWPKWRTSETNTAIPWVMLLTWLKKVHNKMLFEICDTLTLLNYSILPSWTWIQNETECWKSTPPHSADSLAVSERQRGTACSTSRRVDSHLHSCLLLCVSGLLRRAFKSATFSGGKGHREAWQICKHKVSNCQRRMHVYIHKVLTTCSPWCLCASRLCSSSSPPYFHSWVLNIDVTSHKTREQDDVSMSKPETAASKNTPCWRN